MISRRAFEAAWIAHGFLRELVLIYPVYAIYMGEHGVSPLELSVLFLSWSAVALVLEVPSGTLGDRYSRRALIVIAGLIKSLCFWSWLVWPTFPGFLLGFFFWGLGGSLRSGTAEALLYDMLHHYGKPEDFERVYGRGRAGEKAGVVLALVGGGILSEGGYLWPLLLSGLGPVLASVLALLFFRDVPRVVGETTEAEPSDGATLGYFGLLASGIREARTKPALLRFILMFSTGLVVAGVLDEYVGPFLDEVGLRLRAVGVGFALMVAGAALGGLVAHRVRLRSTTRLSLLFLFGSGFLIAGAHAPGWWAVALVVTFYAVYEAGEVLLEGRIQSAIEGPARATVLSLARLTQEFAGIALYLVAGITAERSDWRTAAFVLGLIALLSATLFLVEALIRRRDE